MRKNCNVDQNDQNDSVRLKISLTEDVHKTNCMCLRESMIIYEREKEILCEKE